MFCPSIIRTTPVFALLLILSPLANAQSKPTPSSSYTKTVYQLYAAPQPETVYVVAYLDLRTDRVMEWWRGTDAGEAKIQLRIAELRLEDAVVGMYDYLPDPEWLMVGEFDSAKERQYEALVWEDAGFLTRFNDVTIRVGKPTYRR